MNKYFIGFLVGYFACAVARNCVNFYHYKKIAECNNRISKALDDESLIKNKEARSVYEDKIFKEDDVCVKDATKFGTLEKISILFYDGYTKN